MAVNNSQFNLTIRVNGKEVKNTLNGVGKELRSLRARTKNLTEGTEEWYRANKELAKTEKIYDDMKKNQRELLNETKKNIAADGDYSKSLVGLKEKVSDLKNQIETLDPASKKYQKAIEDYKKVKPEYDKLKNSTEDLLDVTEKNTDAVEAHEKSLTGLSNKITTLKSKIESLEPGTKEHQEAINEYKKVFPVYEKLEKEHQDLLKTTDENTVSFQEFSGSIGQMFSSLKSGDLVGFREGWSGVAQGIRGATKAALSFIATPVGAVVAALVGLFAAGKEIFDFNEGLVQMNNELRALGVAKESISEVRSEIQATAETFDKDFNEIAKKAKSLSESFGISMSEANQMIARGLADGGKMNDEFLDSLGEYDEFFASAGYSAQEFIDVVNQGFELGIYSDKLPDALKEADLSLREQTTATKDALVNAFGATFTKDILDRINSGKITTKEALEEISVEAEKSGLTMQQQAQLTADVFRGAGEDAGGALKVLQAVGQASKRELDEVAQAELELQAANEELNKVQADLFEIEGFGEVWVKIKTYAVQAITIILKQAQILKGQLKTAAEETANFFIGGFNLVLILIPKLLDKISPFLKAIGVDVDELSNKIKNFKIDKVDFTSEKPSEKIKKELSAIEKLQQQAKNLGIQATKEMTEEQLRVLIAAKKKELQKEEELRLKAIEEAKKREEKRLDAIDNLRKEYEKKEEDRLADSATKKAKLAEKRALDEAKRLRASNDVIQKIKKEHSFLIAEAEEKDQQKAEERLQAFEERKRELLNELELSKAETDQEKEELEEEQRLEKEEAALEQMQLTKAEKEELLELMEQNHKQRLLDIEAKYNEERKKENQKFYDELIAAEENLQAAKNNALASGINSLQGFFDESSGIYQALFLLEKGLAAGEVITSAAKGIAMAKANLATVPIVIPGTILPNPMYAVAAATTAKNILATKITAATQLASIGAATIQGFSGGGYTDMFGQGYKDGSGHEVAGVVHTNEYVVPEIVRRDPEVPQILDYLETKRKKKLGLYATGGDTANEYSSSGSGSASSSSNQMMMDMMQAFMQKLDQPLEAPIYFGPEEELKRQEQQKKLDKLKESTQIK